MLSTPEVELAGRHDIEGDKMIPCLSQGGRAQHIVTHDAKPVSEIPRDEVCYSWRIAERWARHIKR
eukprot:1442714-Pyramimonas_sp.AAC.1